MRNAPAVTQKSCHDVFVEGPIRWTVERDVIVVVNPTKIRELQVGGKRGGFARHAFHHVAVSADGVDLEVKNVEAGLVEICAEPLAGDSHSDAVACALSKRTCRGFDAGGDVGFGMARSLASELTESLDFVHRNGERVQDFAVFGGFFDARKMKRGVEEHGSVASRKNEAVAIG